MSSSLEDAATIPVNAVPVNALSAWPVVLGVKMPAAQRAVARSVSCAAFLQARPESCRDVDWEGVLSDLLSPDDDCPQSTRYIDVHGEQLQVSASNTDGGCNSEWGKRFNTTATVNPVISPAVSPEGACTRHVSFLSKVPTMAPVYPEAVNGALNFNLTLGTVYLQKVIKWSGVYRGEGGVFNGGYLLAHLLAYSLTYPLAYLLACLLTCLLR